MVLLSPNVRRLSTVPRMGALYSDSSENLEQKVCMAVKAWQSFPNKLINNREALHSFISLVIITSN